MLGGLATRTWVLLAASAILVLLQVPSAHAETIQQGPWSLSATPSSSAVYRSPAFKSTTGNVYTCVDAAQISGSDSRSWRFALIWYNGGADTVVWRSHEYTSATRHCSPQEHPAHNGKPRFFTRITLTNGAGTSDATTSGLWDMYLDY
jgi:hypothetical protein